MLSVWNKFNKKSNIALVFVRNYSQENGAEPS